MTCVRWNLTSVHLEIVLVLMQDRCMVCAQCTIGSETVLQAPDEAGQVKAQYDLFGDSANLHVR